MFVRSKVSELLKQRAPHAVCDDCISSALSLGFRQQAGRSSRELARHSHFDRGSDLCTVCQKEKLVTRYL